MKVKMRTIYASPQRNANIGEIVDFPDKEAQALIDAGAAEAIDEDHIDKPGGERKTIQKTVQHETATRGPAEDASTRSKRKDEDEDEEERKRKK